MTNDLDDPKVTSTSHYKKNSGFWIFLFVSKNLGERSFIPRKYVSRVKNLGEGTFS